MATKTTEMYYVECDNCGKSLFEGMEIAGWNDESYAIDVASEIEGAIINHEGKDYCPNCAEFDDNDNLIFKTK